MNILLLEIIKTEGDDDNGINRRIAVWTYCTAIERDFLKGLLFLFIALFLIAEVLFIFFQYIYVLLRINTIKETRLK